MSARLTRLFAAPLLAAGLLGCPEPVDTARPVQLLGPDMEHSQPTDTLVEGEQVQLLVSASDQEGVEGVRAFHRPLGTETWDWADMQQAGGQWAASIDLDAPGLEYYFKGTDSGDVPAVSYLPQEAGNSPFALEVLVQALPLPFEEDFELEDSQDDLRDLGWVSYEAEFPGYPWELADDGVDGGLRVRHAVGTGDESDSMDDWLICPALDFSGADRLQVTWYEHGSDPDLADHSLWLSTGSRDPADGDFVEVGALEPPTDEWARSAVVELSDYAGQRVVYLAWRYQGADADSWSIDAVAVQQLAPDLLASVAWGAEPVHPGDDVTLDVTVVNTVDLAASDVVVGLYVDMGDGAVVEDSQELGALAALGETSTSFDFALSGELVDNSRLPVEITIDAGDQSWSQGFELQLGYASWASLEFTLDASALVEVVLGAGDPDDPAWESTILTSTMSVGDGVAEADITDQVDLLPPEPGERRWFARVTAWADGQVDGFSISFGGDEQLARHLPELVSGEETLVYLPEPPDPQVLDFDTSPETVQPGDSVVLAALQLYNDGDTSSGAVQATLSSDDPHVTVTSGGPVEVAAEAWDAGQTTTLLDAFAFDVSAEHLDSLPVVLELQLQDEAETFSAPLTVEVPWPVMRIIRVAVDDSDTGDDDGILDPDEQAVLELDVVNTGDQASDGIVRGSLSVLSSSTGAATVLDGEQSFGSLDPGDSRDEEFEILVTGGSAGDSLDLQLDLYDSSATYVVTTQFVLGEPPWLAVGAVDDDVGDVVDSYDFDWVNAWYRINDGNIQLRYESATEFDPDTVFIEGWGSSSGAGFVLYQLVVQAGSASLLGWPDYGSHYEITAPSLSSPDATSLLLEWDPAVMDLTIDGFSMGFGAGWCGPPDYFCDQFPDGWGYPYTGYDSGDWYDLEW